MRSFATPRLAALVIAALTLLSCSTTVSAADGKTPFADAVAD